MKRTICLLLILLTLFLTACSGRVPENRVHDTGDINGRIVGVMDGSPAENYVRELGGNCISYEDGKAMLSDLLAGKLDCLAAEESVAEGLLAVTSRAKKLDVPLAQEDYRILVAVENPALTKDINAALEAMASDGTMKAMTAACLSGGEYPEQKPLPEDAGSLYVAADPGFPPYCFYGEDGGLTGLFPETAREICRRLGLNAVFTEAAEADFLSLVQSGRAAFAIGRITQDDEAAASYTAPFMQTRQVILVRK